MYYGDGDRLHPPFHARLPSRCFQAPLRGTLFALPGAGAIGEEAMLHHGREIGLIEIVIAILIFSVGIIAAVRALPEGNLATTRARKMAMATDLAQQKIEELMSAPFDAPDLAAGAHEDRENPIDELYLRSWTVAEGEPVPEMKTVTVMVRCCSGGGEKVTLSTYLTSRRYVRPGERARGGGKT
jgi:Tfp pilus assembly protein PilV